MQKQKSFEHTRFSGDVIREAYEKLLGLASDREEVIDSKSLTVEHDDSTWNYDEIENFLPIIENLKNMQDSECRVPHLILSSMPTRLLFLYQFQLIRVAR